MRESTKGPRYLTRWDHSRDLCVCGDVVVTRHRLGELSHFSDEMIAIVIDRHPRSELIVSTMGDNPAHPTEWQLGDLGDHHGSQLLEMIQRGRLELRVGNLHQHQSSLCQTIERLCREVMECQPGLQTFGHQGHLLISSPSASQYFACDPNPCMLWHLRGRTRVWVYPQGDPCLPSRSIEQIVSDVHPGALYYEPAFDDRARVFDLEPGQMLALPQYTPYRVANRAGLNLVLKTQYRTASAVRHNKIHRANSWLRRYVPIGFDSSRTGIARDAMKRILINLVDLSRQSRLLSGDHALPRSRAEKTFCVDSFSQGCVRPLEPSAAQSSAKPFVIPATIETPVAIAAVLEN